MIRPGYQPIHYDPHKSLSTLHAWSSYIDKQWVHHVPVVASVRSACEHHGMTEKKKWTQSVKDVWRFEKSGERMGRFSEAAETINHLSKAPGEIEPSDYLNLLSTNSTSSLCIGNGFCFANLDNVTQQCETPEKMLDKSIIKKPTHRGKDVWRPQRTDGCDGTGLGSPGSTRDGWMAKQRSGHAGYVTSPPSLLPRTKLLTEKQLDKKVSVVISTQRSTELTLNGKTMGSGKDLWTSGRTQPGPPMSIGPPGNIHLRGDSKRRLYLVDIHALCYDGNKVQPRKILEWMKLLLTEVTQDNPIIAVMDGERGNEHRRALLPSYKAKRKFYRPLSVGSWQSTTSSDLRTALPLIHGFLALCHIPLVKVEIAEADDVIATLARQAGDLGLQVVVASPDMDFRQLLSPDVHLLLPLPELGRWSFYTLKHYIMQNRVDPNLELGLRCLLGDASDNVPGLSDLVPGFGRGSALKLMQKHGSLEGLLKTAAVRTVGRKHIQDALTKHANLLRRNFQVLSLHTDVDVVLKEHWCRPRSYTNDVLALELLNERLQGS